MRIVQTGNRSRQKGRGAGETGGDEGDEGARGDKGDEEE